MDIFELGKNNFNRTGYISCLLVSEGVTEGGSETNIVLNY